MVGDTTQYNAAAIKVPENAKVDELLNKVPGVEVKEDGKVKAQGKEVRQINVDGHTFFSDDPAVVLKNLPAKTVDKVQVYDKRSDEDEFIGKPSKKDEKAINLVLKEEARRGYFGNLSAGGSTQDLYYLSGFCNSMYGKSRLTAIAGTNNDNEEAASTSLLQTNKAWDLSNEVVNEEFDGSRLYNISGNSIGNGTKAKTTSTGINYNDDLGIFKNFNGIYFFKKRNINNNSLLNRDYFPISDSSKLFRSTADDDQDKLSHKVTLASDVYLNKTNAVRVRISANTGNLDLNSESGEINQYRSGAIINTAQNRNYSESKSNTYSQSMIYRYKFKKPGRTFNINYDLGYSDRDGFSRSKSIVDYRLTGIADTLDRRIDNFAKNLSNKISLGFNEPVFKFSQMSFDYTMDLTGSDYDRSYRKFNSGAGIYSDFDPALSNHYSNDNKTGTAKASYQFDNDEIEVNAGLAWQKTTLDGTTLLPYNYKTDFSADRLLPSASIKYIFPNKFHIDMGNGISLGYSTRLGIPDISNLQEVLDNSNPLALSIGNKNMKSSLARDIDFRIQNMSSNFKRVLSLSINSSFISRAFATEYFTNMGSADTSIAGVRIAPGAQFSRPVNLDGAENYSSYFTYTFPFNRKHFKSACTFNTDGSYSKNPVIINGISSKTDNTRVGGSFRFQPSYSQKFGCSIDFDYHYNTGTNSAMSNWDNTFHSYSAGGFIRWKFYKTAYFSTDISRTFYTGSYYDSGDYNITNWNFYIGADFLPGNVLSAELQCIDLLNQRKRDVNTIFANYTQFSRTDLLTNYVMLKLTYHFNTLGKTNSAPAAESNSIIIINH